ncbi:hypothetical protein [Sulfitobacter sp. SK011]|uniref:hypothetical protein n=1 Tax=Sulfitobacter sp. SK011 TaxID=1389004 RepID=UPI0013B390CB|nr:hypothetical protein [Sulfitobacter sp. SK011]
MYKSLALIFFLAFVWAPFGNAEGLLDGKTFSGMIGPAENPDLPDNLYFDDGHFWSQICTRCGFVPGVYQAEETAEGVRFTGTLESESRGRFDYVGVLKDDGSVVVSVVWERRRWYWTSTREIMFVGALSEPVLTVSLSKTRQDMQTIDPDGNPLCARF